jgi:hypothetical protein
MSKCLVAIDGGLGKNIMFSSLLPELHVKYDTIYMVSPYWDIFKCCPDIKASFPIGEPTLYQSLVINDDVDVLWKEPYSNSDFIKKKCHLFSAWRKELSLPESVNNLSNTILLSKSFPNIVKQVEHDVKLIGKFILVQFFGGQSPLQLRSVYDVNAEALKRNYQDAQALVDLLIKKYPGYKIIDYSLPNEPVLKDTIKLEQPYLYYSELVKYADQVITIDSSLLHFAAGHNDKVTVLWGETRPDHFGYSSCRNLFKPVLNSQPYFKPLGASPAIVSFYSPDEIISTLED